MDVKGIKVTFLGTGPAGRIPRRICTSPACEDARRPGSKSRRTQSSILIECGGRNILFDVTEDILEQWLMVNSLDHIDAVFITHSHKDAMGGVSKLGIILKRLKQECVFLFAEPETISRIKKMHKNTSFIDFHHIKQGDKVIFNSLAVEAIRVEHTFKKDFPTLGYIVYYHTKKIVYISDAKKVPRASLAKIKNADVLIVDSAMYKKQIPWHMNLEEAAGLIEKVNPQKAFLTQIGIEWPPHKEASQIVRNINPKVGIAYDGLCICGKS